MEKDPNKGTGGLRSPFFEGEYTGSQRGGGQPTGQRQAYGQPTGQQQAYGQPAGQQPRTGQPIGAQSFFDRSTAPQRPYGQGAQGEDDTPEWQKNTWIGPFPDHAYPFDEPENAPELEAERSEDLKNRSGEFWQSQTNGYQFGGKKDGEKTAQPDAGGNKKKDGKDGNPGNPRNPRRRWTALLGTAGVLALLLGVMYFGVFTVRTVRVVGNSTIPDAEIIRLSEIRAGQPMLGLDSGKVERAIQRNAGLKFRYMEKELPGTVILRVQEREACCWMTYNGILYTMDKNRTVLSETENLDDVPSKLVRVDGLNIRSGTVVGQTLTMESTDQQETYANLFLEMKVLGCTELIEQADLSNLSSLLLTTRDGFTVSMGTRDNIHAKLRSMLLTREEVLRRGYRGGVINVTLPETPIFSPQSN